MKKKILLALGGLAAAILLSLPYLLFREQLQKAPALGYGGILLSCLISNAAIMLPTSSTLIVLTASLTLNPFLCILAGGIGAGIGEQVAYLCGRIGLAWSEEYDSRLPKNKVIAWLEKNATLTVFLFALSPLPFDLIGLLAGARKMKWPLFAIAAVSGKVIKFTISVLAVRYLLPVYLDLLPGNLGDMIRGRLEAIGFTGS